MLLWTTIWDSIFRSSCSTTVWKSWYLWTFTMQLPELWAHRDCVNHLTSPMILRLPAHLSFCIYSAFYGLEYCQGLWSLHWCSIHDRVYWWYKLFFSCFCRRWYNPVSQPYVIAQFPSSLVLCRQRAFPQAIYWNLSPYNRNCIHSDSLLRTIRWSINLELQSFLLNVGDN